MASFKTEKAQDVQVRKSFTADPGDESGAALAQTLGQVVTTGIEVYKKHKKASVKSELKQGVEDSGAVVATVNEAMQHSGKGAKTFDPVRGDTLFIDGAPQEFNDRLETVMRESGDEFRAISSAVAQGATPKMAAAVQMEAKLKELTAQYPEFSDELRQTARSLTGYDPTGFHLKQILDITATKKPTSKTFAQKQEEQAQYVASTLNLPIEAVRSGMAKEMFSTTQRNIAQNDMASGTLKTTDYISNDIAENGVNMDQFFVAQRQVLQSGGVTNPEEQVLAMERAKAMHRAEIMSTVNRSGGKIDNATMKFMDDNLNMLYNPVIESIKANDFGKILERKDKALVMLDKHYGRKTWPRLTRMNNALGPKLTGTIIDQMSSFASTAQWNLFVSQQPLLQEIVQGANMSPQEIANQGMDVYEKVLTGKQLTEADKPWLPSVENVIFHPKQDPEIRSKYLESMGHEESRGVGWLAQPGKRANSSERDVKWMKREWKETVPALVNSLAKKMLENPDFTITVTPEGKLQAANTRGSRLRPMHDAEVSQLQYFMNAINNGWASDFGESPATAIKNITQKITQEAENLEGTEAPSVIESVATSASDLVGKIGSGVSDAIKNYEDVVTGKKKGKQGNELIEETLSAIKKQLEELQPEGFQGKDIRK